MFGKIVYISDTLAHIAINEGTPVASNLMNMHVIFEDDNKKILGEVQDLDEKIIKVSFLGEIVNGKFVGGVIRKPTLQANLRLITKEEVGLIVGENKPGSMLLGVSPLYDDYPIMVDINDLFSNHMAIFGNTGSGKSCGVARLMQNLFANPNFIPYRSNFFIFDAYGEYHNAFKDINKINPNYNFKFYTTNKQSDPSNYLKIPLWLLSVDDFALLLGAETHSQLPIIERMLKLVSIFSTDDKMANDYKNHLIAKAIMTILYTNQTSSSKRNDVFAILATCQTPEFNLEAPVHGVGYTRKFRDCFIIDTAGQFPESNLMTEYVSSFIKDELDTYEAKTTNYFTLEDLEKALEFTLISEGLLRNEKSYNDAVMLKVRLHSLTIGENSDYLRYPNYVTLEQYIASLISVEGNRKAQIINFNLEDVDDTFAKVVTKIFTKMLFDFTKKLKVRASIPFHIFLEESHRYVQNDSDKFLLGYNIFERVAKEGRKYGLIFNLISQRPVEISETVISQCSNFLIFKMNHPRDIEYIKKMLPNISAEIVEKQKSLQPGTCVAFGKSFKVPMIVKMQMPSPEPHSSNCDVVNTWQVQSK
ncbi:MAG: ATP-binding protein [Firmicutes bacterium]|nr:ATP-binding protein [Bacillota bacterium]